MMVCTLHEVLLLPAGGGNWSMPMRFTTVADIAAYAAARQTRVVWLAADPALDAVLDDPHTWSGSETHGSPGRIDSATFPGNVVITRSDAPRWGLAPAEREIGALGTLLVRLREWLDVEPSYSPGSTGLAVLRNWLGQRMTLRPSPWGPEAPHLSAHGLSFLLPERYTGQPYLYLVDRTGAYLNAARNGSFGLAGMRTQPADRHDARTYGAWLIDHWTLPAGMYHLAPLPRRGPVWVMTPVLNWLDELGARYEISQVRAWPSRHRIMRDWGDAMLAARQIHPVGKRMCNETIGMFDYRPRVTPEHTAWWYRPDWRAHIVATNMLTTARTIHNLECDGYAVIAAYEDMIAIASEEPTPPAALFRRETVIGGWELEASYAGEDLTHAVIALGTARNVAKWLELLHERQA